MRFIWKLVFVTAVLAWYYHESNIPPDFSKPWHLRSYLAMMKTMMDTTWLLEQLGVTTFPKVVNTIMPMLHRPDPSFDRSRINDVIFDGVGVRIYSPASSVVPAASGFPALVFYHGGGWSVGNVDIYDNFIIPIAKETDMIIISVEYRRPPEHPFPLPFDDCVTATKYFINNVDKYDVDPERIAIGGDSAGGNLAAAVALKLRDERFKPMPKLQVLLYPALQALDFNLPSMKQYANGPLLTSYLTRYFWSVYATGTNKYVTSMYNNEHTTPAVKQAMHEGNINHDNIDMKFHYSPYKKPALDYGNEAIWNEIKDIFLNPYFSPLLAEDMSGLPESYIFTPYYDILRDEGTLYARRLQEAGVRTTHVLPGNVYHGICGQTKEYPLEAGQCVTSIVNFLQERL